MTVVLPRIARLTWTWKTALAWVAFSLAVGFFSGFALVATAIAGVILVLYARSDRPIRIAALTTQAIAQSAIYLEVQRSSDLAQIERDQENLYDGHLTFSWNPIRLGGDVLRHFRRVVNVYPGGPKWLLTIIVLTVIVGLVIAATRRGRSAEALRARFLALLLLFTIVAATLDRFPFGPGGREPHSMGERSTLWLIPVLAIGLAACLQLVRRAAASSRWMRIGFDVCVFVTAALVLHSAIHERALPYAFSGSKEATRYIEQHAGPEDVIILPGPSTMTYAVETSSHVTLRPTPTAGIGFAPRFADRRVAPITSSTPAGKRAEIRDDVRGAHRVFVFLAIPFYGPEPQLIVDTLKEKGFEQTDTITADKTLILVYRSPDCATLLSC